MIVRRGRFNVIVGFLLGLLPLAHAGDGVVSFSKNEQGLAVKTEHGQLALDWYADSIVRVRFVPGQEPWDDLKLRIYPGANGTFTLYEDEGENHNYANGQCSEITFTWNDAKKELTIGDRKGAFQGMLEKRSFRVVLVRPGKATGIALEPACDKTVAYNGERVAVVF